MTRLHIPSRHLFSSVCPSNPGSTAVKLSWFDAFVQFSKTPIPTDTITFPSVLGKQDLDMWHGGDVRELLIPTTLSEVSDDALEFGM